MTRKVLAILVGALLTSGCASLSQSLPTPVSSVQGYDARNPSSKNQNLPMPGKNVSAKENPAPRAPADETNSVATEDLTADEVAAKSRSVREKSSAQAESALAKAAPHVAQSALSFNDYQIGFDDLIEITLFNVPESEQQVLPRTTQVQVSHGGVIALPLVGEMQVAGLTVSDLAQDLQEQYRKYIRDPQIGVLIKQAGAFFVDGAVRKPGPYPLNRTYTLTQALITAGGVDYELAKNSDITIFRQHKNSTEVETINVDLNKIRAGQNDDPQVRAGDVILVAVSVPKYIIQRFLGSMGIASPVP